MIFFKLQVCTGVMMHGYGLVKKLSLELKDFMKKHNFTSIEDFRGYSFITYIISKFHLQTIKKHVDSLSLSLPPLFLYFLIKFLNKKHRASLQYFTTHTDLVKRQQEAIRQRKAIKKGLQSDKDWTGDGFVKESESMVSN
jgi:dihydropyrimidine dehydrogenase (NADP+)